MCAIALLMFYDNRKNHAKKVYRVLGCGLYYVIEKYFCIEYLFCNSKTIGEISSDKEKLNNSCNELLDIGILEVLMNLISCHGFMKNTNSDVRLVCRSRLVNYHL